MFKIFKLLLYRLFFRKLSQFTGPSVGSSPLPSAKHEGDTLQIKFAGSSLPYHCEGWVVKLDHTLARKNDGAMPNRNMYWMDTYWMDTYWKNMCGMVFIDLHGMTYSHNFARTLRGNVFREKNTRDWWWSSSQPTAFMILTTCLISLPNLCSKKCTFIDGTSSCWHYWVITKPLGS